jgi:[ribosomal protein S18]-alanine N-acetyltransferase
VSELLVSRIEPSDRERVDAIARLSAAELDLDAELARSFARIWVARAGASEIPADGFLLAWLVADEIHIINVATHPDRRRCGVAAALLRTLIEHAQSERVRLVLLEVRRSNRPAIQLYRSHGFSAMGLRRAYYADNSEDAIEMMLAIDPATGRILPGRDEITLEA